MFHVFGIQPQEAAERRARKIEALLRAYPRMTREDAEDRVPHERAKELKDFALRETAEQYVEILRAHGWTELSVKIQVFTAPRKAKDRPGRRWIYAHEIGDVDVAQQSMLLAKFQGGMFA